MKHLGLLFTILISILPMLWIEDYTVSHSIWWTVMGAWLLGRVFGWFENKEN